MTIGRRALVEEDPVAPGKVEYVLIDELRRVVLAPVELAPRQGRATVPFIGRLVLEPATTKQLVEATWEGPDGAVAFTDLPDFVSWLVQIKSGDADLRAFDGATLGFDIPAAPGAFAETEGASVARWWAKNRSETEAAVLQILGTVAT